MNLLEISPAFINEAARIIANPMTKATIGLRSCGLTSSAVLVADGIEALVEDIDYPRIIFICISLVMVAVKKL